MTALKLLALDNDDLGVISAHMQDAVFRAGDARWSKNSGQFSLAANRFVWEEAAARRRTFERRRALLVFKRVEAVRSLGLQAGATGGVHSLLAITFTPRGEGPEGTVELLLAGNAAIALDVECLEVALADAGAAWETRLRPRHP